MKESKQYLLTEEIMRFLPPDVFQVQPLDYYWEEAVNAVIFTSGFEKKSFVESVTFLGEFYEKIDKDPLIEDDEDLGCVTIWLSIEKNAVQIDVDVSIALMNTKDTDGTPLEKLNSWIGSSLLTKMAKEDNPALIGMIRIRP